MRCGGEVVEIPRKAKGKNAMKAIRALLLVLALSVSTSAGEMECDKTGNQGNGGRVGLMPNDKTSTIDPVTATALQLLQSILPLF